MTRKQKGVPKRNRLPTGKGEPLKEWVDRLTKDPELAERFVTRWQSAMECFKSDLFTKPERKRKAPSDSEMIDPEDRRFRTKREEDGFSFLDSAPLLVAWCDRHPRIQVDPT